MRSTVFTYSPSVLDADGIALSQTPTSTVTLNGTLVTGGVAQMGAQQYVTITSGSDISNRTFALAGRDIYGNAVTETLTGPNNTTVVSAKSYYTLTAATISGLAAGAITIGVNGTGYSQAIPLDTYVSPFSLTVVVNAITGAAYKLQYTLGDVFASTWPNGTQTWFDHPTMTGKTTTGDATINNPVRAVRFVITTAASPQSLSAQIIQAGGGV